MKCIWSLPVLLFASLLWAGGDTNAPVKVVFHEARIETLAAPATLESLPIQTSNLDIGLTIAVDRVRICNAVRMDTRVDGEAPSMIPVEFTPLLSDSKEFRGFDDQLNDFLARPALLVLSPLFKGDRRVGSALIWRDSQGLVWTREVEFVSSTNPKGESSRRLDTCRFIVSVTNRDRRDHSAELRAVIDTAINENNTPLFYTPVTGDVLDGVQFAGSEIPPYLAVLEGRDDKPSRTVAFFTTRSSGKREGPSRVVLANSPVAFDQWDIEASEAQSGSACVLFWEPKTLKPGQSREMAFAYGHGIATFELERTVRVDLGGSFEPGRTFSVTAQVEAPARGNTLTLRLPDGMKLLEGHEIQAVPIDAVTNRVGVVLWKGRVERFGAFPIQIVSSDGVTQTRTVTVSRE